MMEALPTFGPKRLALLGGLAGIVVWLGLCVLARLGRLSFARMVAVLVTVGVACRLFLCFLTPTFQAPDEQAHFKYVAYLYENRSLPVQTSVTNAPTNDWEYYQPPLYYLALSPLYGIANWLSRGDRDLVVRALRLVSIALWLLTVTFFLRTMDALRISDPFLRSSATATICLLPAYTFVSSMINNDNLVNTICAAAAYRMAKPQSARNSLGIGLLLGVAMLTKLSAVVCVLAAVFHFLACAAGRPRAGSLALRHAAGVCLVALGLFLPWAIRNALVYGDPTAHSVANVPVTWTSTLDGLRQSYEYLVQTFWAVAGIYNQVPYLPPMARFLTYGVILGLAIEVLKAVRRREFACTREQANFFLAMAAAIALNIALVLRFGVLYGWAQGRFLYVLLVPICLVVGLSARALGWSRFFTHAAAHAPGFFMSYAMSFTGYCVGSLRS